MARRNLTDLPGVRFFEASVDESSLAPASQDFGYSLGVLHHVPDTQAALDGCVALLKPGAPFLVYLYYRFDNRPLWFRAIWRASETLRRRVSRLSPTPKRYATDAIALLIYWPLARFAKLCSAAGLPVGALPLSSYRDSSLYTLRTDSRDRLHVGLL